MLAKDLPPAGDWAVRAVVNSSPQLPPGVTLIGSGNTLKLLCRGNGSWQLFITSFNPGYAGAALSYSIDDGMITHTQVSGKLWDHDRIDMDENANALVSQIMTAKKTISFAAGSSTEMTTIDLADAHEAIAPLLDRCPLEKQ